MREFPRVRLCVKWGGCVLAVLLTIAWLGSKWWCLEWHDGTLQEVVVQAGCVRSTLEFGPAQSTSTMNGWYFWRLPPDVPMQWRPRFQASSWAGTIGGTVRMYYIILPMWIPVLLIVAASIVAWRLDVRARRRAMLRICIKCGYDCSGLTLEAKCPECGAPRPKNMPQPKPESGPVTSQPDPADRSELSAHQ